MLHVNMYTCSYDSPTCMYMITCEHVGVQTGSPDSLESFAVSVRISLTCFSSRTLVQPLSLLQGTRASHLLQIASILRKC